MTNGLCSVFKCQTRKRSMQISNRQNIKTTPVIFLKWCCLSGSYRWTNIHHRHHSCDGSQHTNLHWIIYKYINNNNNNNNNNCSVRLHYAHCEILRRLDRTEITGSLLLFQRSGRHAVMPASVKTHTHTHTHTHTQISQLVSTFFSLFFFFVTSCIFSFSPPQSRRVSVSSRYATLSL